MDLLIRSQLFFFLHKPHSYALPTISTFVFLFLLPSFLLTVPGLSCGSQNLSLQHVGSINSSLTREQTQQCALGAPSLKNTGPPGKSPTFVFLKQSKNLQALTKQSVCKILINFSALGPDKSLFAHT